MTGIICVQGGNEFTPSCHDVDRAWLGRAGPGAVTIVPLACAAGVEYRTAGSNGIEYLRGLGAEDVSLAPEPDVSLDAAVRAIVAADIVVIPGGSPARIRRRVLGTAIGAALRAHLARGGALIGASAGAMVLADVMFVPGSALRVGSGLGALRDLLVLPHYGSSREELVTQLRATVGDTVTILGLPTCCGVLYGDDQPTAYGAQPCLRFTAGADPAPFPSG